MRIEEAGPDPRDFARAIHEQLGDASGTASVHEIAFALDIVEIRECELVGFEGALVMTPDRNEGAIAVKRRSSPEPGRVHFTIAHELLHFLNVLHVPTDPGQGFQCTQADMRAGSAKGGRSQHFRQEAEANLFAIELLAPPHLTKRLFAGPPDLAQVLALAQRGLSREAAARRLVELNEAAVAMIFTKDQVVRYSRKHPTFPRLAVVKGQRTPELPAACNGTNTSAIVEVDPKLWLRGRRRGRLTAQTLWQREGYAMTLLSTAES